MVKIRRGRVDRYDAGGRENIYREDRLSNGDREDRFTDDRVRGRGRDNERRNSVETQVNSMKTFSLLKVDFSGNT